MAQLAQWHVLIPVRGGLRSKSRLANIVKSPEDRLALAVAFASDVVASTLKVKGAVGVTVITADLEVSHHLAAVGADTFLDPEEGGLNGAVEYGVAQLRSKYPDAGIAVLMGDIPEVTSESISEALTAAAAEQLGVIADHDGTGTTLLTAASGQMLRPNYGEGSFKRHVAAGHVPLNVPEDSLIRRDTDAREDLLRVLRSSVGPHTEAVLSSIGLRNGLALLTGERLSR